MGNTPYGLTQVGHELTIYEAKDGKAQKLTTLHVNSGPNTRSGSRRPVRLVPLPGCRKPIVAYDALAEQGSGAAGWDGSNYSAYKSSGRNLVPSEGSTIPNLSFGVYAYGDDTIEFLDGPNVRKGKGNLFKSCTVVDGKDELVLE